MLGLAPSLRSRPVEGYTEPGVAPNQITLIRLRLGRGLLSCLTVVARVNADFETPILIMTSALAEKHTPPAPAQVRATSVTDSLLRAIRWQVSLTLLLALVCVLGFGLHAGLSALLGGSISVAAAWVFRWLVGRSRSLQLMDTMLSMLKAEAAKVGVIISGLLLSFVLYKDVVAVALVGVFIVTTVMFAGAAFLMPSQAAPAQK